MISDPTPADEGPSPRRLFVFEPGWKVGMKVGSVREFCYKMAPGQDFYHRLCDGEIFLQRGDERICLACAERSGVLAYEPKGLREPHDALGFDVEGDDLDVGPGTTGPTD